MLNTKKLKAYARKYKAMKACDRKAKQLRKQLDMEAQPLLDHMVDEEIDRLNLKGGDVLIAKTEIWGKIVAKDEFGNTDKPKVILALREAGLSDIVTEETYQTRKLASYLRELDKDNQPLPECFKNVIIANPTPKLIVKNLK